MAEELAFATDLARRAGEVLLSFYDPAGLRGHRTGKGRARDFLTEADRASETLVVEELSRAFPDDAIVAEEGGSRPGNGRRTWYVDPLDGTVNFSRGHPFFAVSIGLVAGGVPLLGAVHAPVLGETFAGEVGVGAVRNGESIAVSGIRDLPESLLATGFAYVRNESPDDNVDNFARLILKVLCIRRAGAASLDLAYVAAGRLDGFWELHLSAWDVAAGAAIVRAAGGTVTDLRGGEDFLTGRHIVATNGRLHEDLRANLCPLRSL
ncbi:MAG: inositol monophosphatase [Planctomycetes bacterium]|jgi:myo-inositol-1(or 4)-monophosphatase|nr:inositol monophosphatase [Planctomycetota bacterium]